MKTNFLPVLILLSFFQCSIAQKTERLCLSGLTSSADWRTKSQNEVGVNSVQIFKPGFDAKKWVKAIVPGTVFSSYVAAGLEKDPNFADNAYTINHSKYEHNYWYRTEFNIPTSFDKKMIWLNLEGINRKADVFVNGIRIGGTDGFYERGKFNITSLLSKTKPNVLAILVYLPSRQLNNLASPTYLSSDGWDWMPPVPGMNMGITDDVYLSNTNDVTLVDPWIRTMELSDASAALSLDVELGVNTTKERTGELTAIIQPGNIHFTKKVQIRPGDNPVYHFDKTNTPELLVQNPQLWWPNGYGKQNLYTCNLQFSEQGVVSDTKEVEFGIRQYSYDTLQSVLHVKVNGVPIFMKGGNWGMSEYMLRCRGEEYDTKLRLHKEMNYNIIRNWIGSTTDEEFYKACDKYGIMVWDDFWLHSTNNKPTDIYAFNKNAVEKIKRLRNFPCVAIWCGENESYPQPPLNGWLRENVRTFDGDDRKYQANSHSDALTGSGIWNNQEIGDYFECAPRNLGGNRGYGVRSEIGTAVFTTFESFKEFMPKKDWWPQNEMWDKHFFGPSAIGAGPDQYTKSLGYSYGKPTGIEEFCKRAQLLNIETNKAMYESWLNSMWNDASGIIIWMSQSAYPSMVWQTYDYYYDLTGAYWGAKKACEPLHIFWNTNNNQVRVSNTSNENLRNATAEIRVYNKDGKEVPEYRSEKKVDVVKNTVVTSSIIAFPKDENLAYLKPVTVSATSEKESIASNLTDGSINTRWSGGYDDKQWFVVDLEHSTTFNTVDLYWESAFAKKYILQVSDDQNTWKEVYQMEASEGGRDRIVFAPVKARYLRMQSLQRATMWGISLWELKIYNHNDAQEDWSRLSDVHFIKLTLKDTNGKLLSDNFYWRGKTYLDYKGLNNMPKPKLQVESRVIKKDGKCQIDVTVKNLTSSPALAYAIRIQAVNAKTGKRILPMFMTDNYFSLVKGESKHVQLECKQDQLEGDEPKILVEAYNPGQK